jgi:hypothetical protein
MSLTFLALRAFVAPRGKTLPKHSLELLDELAVRVLGLKASLVSVHHKANGIPEKPTAMVGLNRIQRTIAEMIGRVLTSGGKFYFADTLESAKEWLVQQ